jgi:serine protease
MAMNPEADRADARRHIVVKLFSGAEVPPTVAGLRLQPMFTTVSPRRLQELVAIAVRNDPAYRPPDFRGYQVTDVSSHSDSEIGRLVEVLRAQPEVEEAYASSPGGDPAVVTDDEFYSEQGYLQPGPIGINAPFAWETPGGDGAAQSFVDMEMGWTLNHEDLVAHNIQLLPMAGSLKDSSRAHGTSVLGIVCGVDNEKGILGITPNLADVSVVSYFNSTRPNAIMAAINALPYGGVLLLEAQIEIEYDGNIYEKVPIEVESAEFDTIRLATAIGITVVEAAGNGGHNLDIVPVVGGKHALDRKHADARDSGAIVVGASAPDFANHGRSSSSNYGNRVDCFAWGDGVYTATSYSHGTTDYYYFGGTSSAAAIVAGAALAVQGVAWHAMGMRLSPFQMRQLLADKDCGTASHDPDIDRIGVMPDLMKLLTSERIGVAPDLYMRDFVGDDGQPHGSAVSASPDIIVRPARVLIPEAAFGEGSGTRNSDSLGQAQIVGQDNFIYVRVLNRGAMADSDAKVEVYWAPVATLQTPDSWTSIGSAKLATIPGANVLSVFGEITWPAANVPAGPVGLVAIVGSARDPAPQISTGMTLDEVRRLIRENNNVALRCLNEVDIEPATNTLAPGYAPVEFIVRGAPDARQSMSIEVVARLPLGSRILMEMPNALYERLSYRLPRSASAGHATATAFLSMNPHGSLVLEDVDLPRRAEFAVRLLVHVPEGLRNYKSEVYARQVFRGLEVGRVTWRFGRSLASSSTPPAFTRAPPLLS